MFDIRFRLCMSRHILYVAMYIYLFGDFHNLVLNSPVAINIPNFLLLLFGW